MNLRELAEAGVSPIGVPVRYVGCERGKGDTGVVVEYTNQGVGSRLEKSCARVWPQVSSRSWAVAQYLEVIPEIVSEKPLQTTPSTTPSPAPISPNTPS